MAGGDEEHLKLPDLDPSEKASKRQKKRALIVNAPLKSDSSEKNIGKKPQLRKCGRVYDEEHAEKPRGKHLKDMMLGMRMAGLAYTEDEKPNGLTIVALAAGGDIAWENDYKLSPILHHLGYKPDCVFSYHDGAAQGFIAHRDDVVVLSFRGTDGILDWVTNIDFGMAEWNARKLEERSCLERCFYCKACCCTGKPRVHGGMYDAFIDMKEDLEQVLKPFIQNKKAKRFVLTGHSLGGALATAAFSYIVETNDFAQSPHSLLLVTIGQPRFGDSRFLASLQQKISRLEKLDKCVVCRIVNENDIVPTFPLESLGYRHIQGSLCLFSDAGELMINPSVEDAEHNFDITECLGDHMPEVYFKLVAEASDRHTVLS